MPRHRTAHRFPKFAALALWLPTALAAGGCASIELSRDTQTSGAFVSKGFAFTIASIDIPRPAILIARDNAVDARLTNMQVTSSSVTPDLGWWDWLLDIIGVRWATIRGTWGFSGETPQASGAAAD
jgi:hypothetical protein